jgi:ADP-heptose:LPS heptosyltransferase
MKYIDKNNIKKIILLRNDKIGDMVISCNVIRELRKSFPNSHITMVASRDNLEIIEKNRKLNTIKVLDYPPNNPKRILNYIREMWDIRKEKYDLGIDLRGSAINVFTLFYLTGVKYKVGFYNRLASKLFLNYSYKKDRENLHSVKHRIDLINKALDINAKNYWPDIETSQEDSISSGNIRKENGLKKYIVIVPDASLDKKQWSLDNYDEAIKFITKTYKEQKIIIAGVDNLKLNWLAERNPHIIKLNKPNLRVLYLLFKDSSLVIAPDGGPMHLAWASNAKLIALMAGYLGIKYIGPLGKDSKILVSDIDNINSIKVDEVKKAIREHLDKK